MGDTFVLVGEAPSSHPAPRMVARGYAGHRQSRTGREMWLRTVGRTFAGFKFSPPMDRKQGVRVTDLTLRILDAGLPGRQPEINGNPEAVGETHKAEANQNSD
jgi:hypothetical protein